MAPKKKLQLPPPPTDEEEYWDSQAEEVLDEEEEEDMMEDWESLDEEASEAEEVSDETPSPSVAFPSPAPQKSATGPSMATTSAPQAPPALPVRRPNRRWDTTGTRAGKSKQPPPLAQEQQQRQGYRSWRGHKNAIVACLQDCGGNISFARRFLLYHHGVAFPRNILHYYRHLYSPYCTGGSGSNSSGHTEAKATG
ncbi:22K [Human mastadenovirus C]|uniref:22K n=1 Tax=Human mastadenovirus C TaxID=129951 RepID=A0A3Q9HK06_9ADEN|nr:22K [Human mastadenovirus C]QYJ58276.1 22K [Human mastadenovirus C]WEG79466.1 22K [Human adenovirus 1]WEG81008.1 L4 encapsidation protein [Human adenovirus 1]BDX51425.1 encapsidation protein 22k [Human mastadenovirus C]